MANNDTIVSVNAIKVSNSVGQNAQRVRNIQYLAPVVGLESTFAQANAAFAQANAAFASANNVSPQIAPAFATANAAYATANAAFASANNVSPQIAPAFATANAAFAQANAAFASANNVSPQIAPAFATANAAFTQANAAYELANTASANSTILETNSYISSNVAILRGEISANVVTLRGEITANAASANSVINTNISANVATLRGEITANAASANSVINTNISANVATLRGEITANAVSANSVINTNISANVVTLRGEITANAVSANSVINTNISANVATLRGEITANAASANSVINTNISANVATLRGEISSNISTANLFSQSAFDRANTGIANNTYALLNNIVINSGNSNVAFSDGSSLVSSWKHIGGKSIAAQEGFPTGLHFKPDGTRMFVVGQNSDAVQEYNLAIPWSIASSTFSSNVSIGTQDTSSTALAFKPDGTLMYVLGDSSNSVFQYTVSTAWQANTATYASKSLSTTAQEGSPTGMWFKPDGTTLFIVGSGTDFIYRYTLVTPWDVSTATYSNISFNIAPVENNVQDICFSDDGLTFWVTGHQYTALYQYKMSVAWDITTATLNSKRYVGFIEALPTGLFVSLEDNRAYIVGHSIDTVQELDTNSGTLLTVANTALFTGDVNFANTVYIDGGIRANTTLSVIGAVSLSSTLTVSSTLTNPGGTTSATTLGTAATTGTTQIGSSTTQTGSIIVAPTTSTQNTFIQTGATIVTSTKTLFLGTGGVAGSNTNIIIGANNTGANGNTILFGPNVTVSAANTAQTIFKVIGSQNSVSNVTGTMTVAGGVGISGNLYSTAIYESLVSNTTRLFDSANLVINAQVSANAASANSVINTNISANVATLRGEITANAVSANSVIDTNISANVATLRGEITANAVSANAVINAQITANIANTVLKAGSTMTGVLQISNTTISNSNSTGALVVTGGVGVTDSLYVGNRVGWSNSTTSVIYQVYNSATNSLDTVFG